MIKHTKGWELSSKLDHKHSIYIRSCSGAKSRSMKDYVKSYARDNNPDHIIMHVWTQDLNFKSNPRKATDSIDDLSEGMISEKKKVKVSGIIPENDVWKKRQKR